MKVFIAIFITMHMSIMVGALLLTSVSFGNKVDGNPERIGVVDTIDILTATEEEQTLRLLKDVYEKSGMPVTVFTDDFSWKEHYDSIEVYSEELYYAIGMDETAMVILFTQDNASGFTDWEYDMYCGDDTVSCLSDAAFDKLLDAFQKAMAKQDLCYALDYSFTLVMGDLAKTTIKPEALPIVFFLLCFYGIFYASIFGGNRDSKRAAKYFKEHPEKFENEPMTLYSECPSCGAQNTMKEENCPYCGTLLKLSDGNVTYVKP